jgi:hypothetical protein
MDIAAHHAMKGLHQLGAGEISGLLLPHKLHSLLFSCLLARVHGIQKVFMAQAVSCTGLLVLARAYKLQRIMQQQKTTSVCRSQSVGQTGGLGSSGSSFHHP